MNAVQQVYAAWAEDWDRKLEARWREHVNGWAESDRRSWNGRRRSFDDEEG